MTFSSADTRRVSGWGGSPVECDLVLYVPPLDDSSVSAWRSRLQRRAGDPIVAMVGQIRRDKGVDDFLRAITRVTRPVTIAVVGEDKGDYARCRALAIDLGVEVVWVIGYLSLTDLVAAIAAADVIVAPYAQASQSAVVSLSAQVGTTSVAYPVGGLSKYATLTAMSKDVDSLAEAIDRAFEVQAHGSRLTSGCSLAVLYGDG